MYEEVPRKRGFFHEKISQSLGRRFVGFVEPSNRRSFAFSGPIKGGSPERSSICENQQGRWRGGSTSDSQRPMPEQPLDVAVAALKQEKRLYRELLQRWERETPESQMLLAGTCDQCETCEKVQGHPCGRPELLRYSIEALGGDVEGCLQHYFHLPMLWGRDGKAPDYFVLVGGLLTK